MKPFIQSRERNDCTVLALAHAANLTYKQAHVMLFQAGRMPEERFYLHSILGETLNSETTFHNIKATLIAKAITWQEFMAAHYNPNLTFIAVTYGHAFAITNGHLYDFSSRKRTTTLRLVWRITTTPQ